MLNNPIFRLLCLSLLFWGGLFYSSIASTVAIWYRSETFAHGFIILPICIYLIKEKWATLNQAEIRPNMWTVLLIIPVLILWIFGSLAQLLVIEQAAAFLMLPMIIWCVMGNQVAKVLFFTLAFWMFSVPVGEFLIPQLQELTADITVWLLQITGIPVYRDGLYLMVPGGLFEVAVACSGIRYLIASFTLGSLFAYLNYTSLKKRSIFILFSLFLPLLANGIRAYGIVMIAHLSDMKYATGADHLVYGWIFFAFVIFIMFAVGSIWSDSVEKQATDGANAQQKSVAVATILKVSFAALLLIAAAIGYKSVMQNQVLGKQVNLSELYGVSEPISDQSWLPTFKNPSSMQSGHTDGLDVFIAYYQTNKQNSEMINSTNWEYNKTYWTIVSREDLNNTSLLEINNTAGTRRLLGYTFVNAHLISSSKLKVKLSQSIQAFIGQAQSGVFIAVSKPVVDKSHDRSLIEAELQAITQSAQDILFDE